MPAPTCSACHSPGDRLHACLSCDEFACWRRARPQQQARSTEPHIVQHLRSSRHQFALDFVHLAVFCLDCGDYVYDAAITAWLLAAQIRWHAALCDSAEPEAKRPRIVSTGADLSPAQTKYLREHGAVQACGGVRGLLNLGATCYLSVVLQALAHNPLVRGWMLSDGHHPSTCRVGRNAQQQQQQLKEQAPAACMACELEAALQAFHSGDAAPLAPVGLLRTMWLLRGDLAGYGQQDAHEWLMALLDTLHVGLTENALVGNGGGGGGGAHAHAHAHSHLHPCACLVHQAFAGVLQSTVTCSGCGNTTHAHDPMLDISLDIPARPGLGARAVDASLNEWLETRTERGARNTRRGTGARANASLTRGQHPVLTLHDCLAHYTRAEPLASGAYACSRCGASSGSAVKQLCVKELPPVLTFQLKRFEHTAGARPSAAHAAKVDAYVRLPLLVDMTPYTAAALAAHSQTAAGLRAAAGHATSSTGSALAPSVGGIAVHDRTGLDHSGVSRDTPIPVLDGPGGSATLGKRRTDAVHSNPACQYALFAVIDHIGHLDTGHYTAYAKHRGQWFKFDDAAVTPADIRDVLGLADETRARQGLSAKGRAYMAFYVKTTLDYHDGAPGPVLPNSAGRDSVPPLPPPMAAMGSGNTRIGETG
ncbi:hypothetical protein LPJ66_011305, partial [Kickxella alabastrina]